MQSKKAKKSGSEIRVKEKHLLVRVSSEDKTEFIKDAESVGKNISQFIIFLWDNWKGKRATQPERLSLKDTELINKLCIELSKNGSFLNQYMKEINQGKGHTSAQRDAFFDMIDLHNEIKKRLLPLLPIVKSTRAKPRKPSKKEGAR